MALDEALARREAGLLAELVAARLVPVVVLDEADAAPALGDALTAGGLRAAEITLRTPAGVGAIAALAGREGLLLGAGTVLTPEDVDRVADAGARFVVSPGLDREVVERTRERGLLPLPGVATATEVQQALRLGLQAVKLFPADRLGGLDTVRALAAPFPELLFMPSGGVSPENAVEYLAHPAIAAISGSWMVPRDALREGDWRLVERLSAAAWELVGGDELGRATR
ncbi:bifunctional 4-hydroxy-2-oxoglutarate aldolase/2-dehydro-3-deoxy-phosphogluconate aldolase [Homoserinibacter sp. YIM 151385]|uniref:bifunctional 4-hydroxy-2-oxoglutarate aldolase/2-dehydro-3-deoxy-phosphogluconate aldolase n=1 Tax=Homoserinibacter sp. YIM 151385 TaxID=2985506 RepID=UPI0022EFE5E6|nr:bifunctional 4-hydroxy-2-oxoglutarate aldolase/2-dehydro-3-deoxy-phosphogluconate aldolase [Homoserinibacter sp. YIM 151385]WBU38011.1 bifunctional 4-hydroxy-2-oxoglutarate aldolase/2-dehydro-3-deoxy-phosphogluconate aldolase [Homoserinibacter sp. YIM 151385]